MNYESKTFNRIKRKFKKIGWVLEKDIHHGYVLWSNEHAPGEEYQCRTLQEALSYYRECKDRSENDK